MTPTMKDAAASPQLELFDHAGPGLLGISAHVARAEVSPGWWPLLAPLFEEEELVINECRERDGRLVLVASERERAQDDAVPDWLKPTVARAERTCGACGSASGTIRVLHDRTVRVLCDGCRQQVSDESAFAVQADRFFRFDGLRRIPPTPLPTSGHVASPAAAPASAILPPDELRQLVRVLAASMADELRWQDEARLLLAMCGAMHVAAGLSRGPRLLIVGRTGTGKTTSVLALQKALERAGYRLPVAMVDATGLSSPGWHGLNLPDAVLQAVHGHPAASKAIVVIDELHHIGLRPDEDVNGTTRSKKAEVLSSLQTAVGGGEVTSSSGSSWDSRPGFIVGIGAFTDRLDVTRPIDTQALVDAGIPIELATRFESIVRLAPLHEQAIRDIVEHSPAVQNVTTMAERLGFTVTITREALAHAARMHALSEGRESPRSAIGWVVSAVRSTLLHRFMSGETDVSPLVITPDSLAVPAQVSSNRHARPDGRMRDDGDPLSPR